MFGPELVDIVDIVALAALVVALMVVALLVDIGTVFAVKLLVILAAGLDFVGNLAQNLQLVNQFHYRKFWA